MDTGKHESLRIDDDIPSGAQTPVNKFTLDSVIEDEGGNLSIGQVCLPLLGLYIFLVSDSCNFQSDL